MDRSGIPGGQDTMEEERNGAIVREGHETRASVIVLLGTGYRSSGRDQEAKTTSADSTWTG